MTDIQGMTPEKRRAMETMSINMAHEIVRLEVRARALYNKKHRFGPWLKKAKSRRRKLNNFLRRHNMDVRRCRQICNI